nr:uncharacterized protein LOC102145028 isoform X4 [Macaca fascicularis]
MHEKEGRTAEEHSGVSCQWLMPDRLPVGTPLAPTDPQQDVMRSEGGGVRDEVKRTFYQNVSSAAAFFQPSTVCTMGTSSCLHPPCASPPPSAKVSVLWLWGRVCGVCTALGALTASGLLLCLVPWSPWNACQNHS